MEMGLSQADAARRLNVSRSVVQRLWEQYQSEDSVSEDLFQADHELQHLQKPFSSSFGTKKNHYCAAARCRPLSSIRKKNLRYYGAKSSSQCRRWWNPGLQGSRFLHVFHGGTVTGLRYSSIRPYAAAIGNDFILMDDNARPHRARIVEVLSRFGTNGMASLISRPESDRTSLGLSWQKVAALNPPQGRYMS
ncbi:uncharacterized protein TNCV_3639011 [Trichonephila clavipes]|nr:uncharacterized protein TNCV_3639011 [Trichonephila clavipes]